MIYRLKAVLAVTSFCALSAPAWAACAGLSNGSIPTRFSEALQACATAAPASAPPVVVPQAYDLPATANVPFSAVAHRRPARTRAAVPATIATVSRRYRIDPLLLHAIVARESGGRTGAISAKGALGLMQVMPGTARGLGVTDTSRLLTDPGLNLVTGATYLKRLQGQFGNDVPTILAAYNAGPGAVRRFRGVPRYAETQAYVRTIMGRYQAARAGVLR